MQPQRNPSRNLNKDNDKNQHLYRSKFIRLNNVRKHPGLELIIILNAKNLKHDLNTAYKTLDL